MYREAHLVVERTVDTVLFSTKNVRLKGYDKQTRSVARSLNENSPSAKPYSSNDAR